MKKTIIVLLLFLLLGISVVYATVTKHEQTGDLIGSEMAYGSKDPLNPENQEVRLKLNYDGTPIVS